MKNILLIIIIIFLFINSLFSQDNNLCLQLSYNPLFYSKKYNLENNNSYNINLKLGYLFSDKFKAKIGYEFEQKNIIHLYNYKDIYSFNYFLKYNIGSFFLDYIIYSKKRNNISLESGFQFSKINNVYVQKVFMDGKTKDVTNDFTFKNCSIFVLQPTYSLLFKSNLYFNVFTNIRFNLSDDAIYGSSGEEFNGTFLSYGIGLGVGYNFNNLKE